MSLFNLSFLILALSFSKHLYADIPSNNSELMPLTMCVFDFIGNDGPAHKAMKEYKIDAYRWGVDLSFKVYTDDRVASEEFKNGVCDMLNLPGIRARE
jgi:hypothetical protein